MAVSLSMHTHYRVIDGPNPIDGDALEDFCVRWGRVLAEAWGAAG